jgi:hypothetical protein
VARIVGALADVAKREMRLSGPNLTTGFHASAVDLGRLQAAPTRGTARFDMVQIAERWDEVRAWMHDILRAWVQRCKKLHVELRESGIRVELEPRMTTGTARTASTSSPTKGRTPRVHDEPCAAEGCPHHA